MYVIKRDGRRELVQFDKITARIKKLCYSLHESVDPQRIAMRVIEGVYDGVTTTELDNLAAEVAATSAVTHPDYASLASRIAVSNLHKATKKSFAETIVDLYNYIDPITGDPASLIAKDVYEIIQENAEFLDSQIIYDRDFSYDFFGFKTLERSYLLKMNGTICVSNQESQKLVLLLLLLLPPLPLLLSRMLPSDVLAGEEKSEEAPKAAEPLSCPQDHARLRSNARPFGACCLPFSTESSIKNCRGTAQMR